MPSPPSDDDLDLHLLLQALSQKFPSSSSNIPLSALMILDRWYNTTQSHIHTRLLSPPPFPTKLLIHKAKVLHQTTRSPSLQQEIKRELLHAGGGDGDDDDDNTVTGSNQYPYLYDIPLPPSPLQQQQQKQHKTRIRDTHKHFSTSHYFTASREFYAQGNANVWESQVPYGVTTNSMLVDNYARVILGYLADVQDQYQPHIETHTHAHTHTHTPTKVYIVELAAGHGLFGYCLAKRLREEMMEGEMDAHTRTCDSATKEEEEPWKRVPAVKDAYTLLTHALAATAKSNSRANRTQLNYCRRRFRREKERAIAKDKEEKKWSFCVVVTDFNRQLLEDRIRMPWVESLMAEGLLEFAVLDASPGGDDDDENEQQFSSLQFLPLPRDGKNGYGKKYDEKVLLPGSIEGPVFVVGNYALDSFPVDIFVQTRTEGLREMVVNEANRHITLVPCIEKQKGGASEYAYASLLSALRARGEEGLHVINIGYLRLLRRIKALLHPSQGGGNLAVLLADGVFQYDDPLWVEMEVEDAEAPHEQEKKEESENGENNTHTHTQVQRRRPPPVCVSLPDMSPCPDSGCFALASDPQSLAWATMWVLEGDGDEKGEEEEEEEEDKRGDWLAVRNTVVEGSLTVALIARRRHDGEQENGAVSLTHTRKAFWKHLCLMHNPNDLVELEGLILNEAQGSMGSGGSSGSSSRTFLSCLGLRGMVALLRWSSYDWDLFLALRWRLRDAFLKTMEQQQQSKQEGKGEEDDINAVAAVVVETALRCFSHRLCLRVRAWHSTRYECLQFLYALGRHREVVGFFLQDTQQKSKYWRSLSSLDQDFRWKHQYNDYFASAREAFLVVRSLEQRQEEQIHVQQKDRDKDGAMVRQILAAILAERRLMDGKGRKRIKNYLETKMAMAMATPSSSSNKSINNGK